MEEKSSLCSVGVRWAARQLEWNEEWNGAISFNILLRYIVLRDPSYLIAHTGSDVINNASQAVLELTTRTTGCLALRCYVRLLLVGSGAV